MAYSTQRAVSNGTLQLLSLSINFFDKSEISVYLNNVPTSAYTWATANSIHMNSVVPNGVELLVRRTTDLSDVRHVFSLGAQFKDSTLDDDFRQILHIAQEAVEGANVGDIYSTLNMHGNVISNVGPATADGDAISLGQVRTESQGAYLANSQAQTAATAAGVSQGAAAASATASAASAVLSQSQVALATAQASTATAQAGLAATAKSGADAAQAAAAASSTLAQKWAAELEDVVVAGGLYSAFHYSRKASASATAAASSASAAAASAASINLPAIAGNGLKLLRANSAATALEYVDPMVPIRPVMVGTVSQSAGVPTGAIIGRGTDGTTGDTWVRWADGTQMCQRVVTLSGVSLTTAAGSMYSHTGDYHLASNPFPVPFLTGTVPSVTDNYFATVWYGFSCSTTPQTATTWPALKALSVASASGVTITNRLTAWGRWY